MELHSCSGAFEILKDNLPHHEISFVFPSQTSADTWVRALCTRGIVRSLALDRFLAWDRFKEKLIQERERQKSPATALLRKLFTEALIRRNAQEGGKMFKALIPPEHAQGGGVFRSTLARLLPSLAYWEKLHKARHAEGALDDEDQDFLTLKGEYGAFLEAHSLFEPSWEEVQIRREDQLSSRYIIFFPQLIEDFSEYQGLLLPPRFTLVHGTGAPEAERVLYLYQSAREEIRSTALELQRLHTQEGIPYEEMALSVPGLEEMESSLVKELYLREIPFTRRAGKKLGQTGAGRFFQLVLECGSSRYSFEGLKALVLNDHIPWKDRSSNQALVSFGIRYNCVSGYTEGAREVDIWEEAFRGTREGGDLSSYYRGIKQMVQALGGSKTFGDLRRHYFEYRARVLNIEEMSDEDNDILSRCIEELNSLVDLEEKLSSPDLVPSSPLAFFVSCLEDKEYVRAGQNPGVSIFPWRVASASPFTCHFVLNASQSAATVLYQTLGFLRIDKRRLLQLEDQDATGAFLALCNPGEGGHGRYSVSLQSYSGWAVPHSYFAQAPQIQEPCLLEDPYQEERSFWLGQEGAPPSGALKLYPLQKKSFEVWKEALTESKQSFSLYNEPIPRGPQGDLLHRAILGDEGFLTVTATNDLVEFYQCPVMWLYRRILGVREYSLEAALLDDLSLGILYHRILEKLFTKIREEDGPFRAARLEVYKSWTLDLTRAAIQEHPAFRGPLAIPLVLPQARGMAQEIRGLLDVEARYFDGWETRELEVPLSYRVADIHIKGIIDRVIYSPQGEGVIIDYKTRGLPDQVSLQELEEDPQGARLREFQLPLYVKLYEEKKAQALEGAYFSSITEHKMRAALGSHLGSRAQGPSREEYGVYLDKVQEQIEEFDQKVRALDFTPPVMDFKTCQACEYKTICRSTYSLNQEGSHGLS